MKFYGIILMILIIFQNEIVAETFNFVVVFFGIILLIIILAYILLTSKQD